MITLFITLFICLIWYWSIEWQIEHLNKRNQSLHLVLQNQNKWRPLNLDDEILKKKLQMHDDRVLQLAEFNLNQAVCFHEIKRQQNAISFFGEADSIWQLTHFLKIWPLKNAFAEIKINDLQNLPNHKTQFHLIAREAEAIFASEGGGL